MKKFAAIAGRNGTKALAGYTKSAAVCRAFLDGYAPKRGSGADAGSGGGGASTVASGEVAPNARQTRRRNQRRRGGSQIVPSGSGGIRGGHAASHPLRQQGGCVKARSSERGTARAAGSRRRASTCPPFGSGAGCSDSQRRGRAARSGYHPVGNGRRSGSGARGLVGREDRLRRRRRPTRVRG